MGNKLETNFVELPCEFDGKPIREGDKFKYLKSDAIHIVVWVESALAFRLKNMDDNITGNPRTSISMHQGKWEYVGNIHESK